MRIQVSVVYLCAPPPPRCMPGETQLYTWLAQCFVVCLTDASESCSALNKAEHDMHLISRFIRPRAAAAAAFTLM